MSSSRCLKLKYRCQKATEREKFDITTSHQPRSKRLNHRPSARIRSKSLKWMTRVKLKWAELRLLTKELPPLKLRTRCRNQYNSKALLNSQRTLVNNVSAPSKLSLQHRFQSRNPPRQMLLQQPLRLKLQRTSRQTRWCPNAPQTSKKSRMRRLTGMS